MEVSCGQFAGPVQHRFFIVLLSYVRNPGRTLPGDGL